MSTNSIEFYVDEESDQLIVVERGRKAASMEGDTEQLFSVNLSDIRAKTPAEAQRDIGRLVLTFLNSRSSRGLNLPRDREDEQRLDKEYEQSRIADTNPSDPEKQHELALSYINRGIQNNNWKDIEAGELWLAEAAANGHPEAVAYQAEWTLLKPRLEHKIKGASDGGTG